MNSLTIIPKPAAEISNNLNILPYAATANFYVDSDVLQHGMSIFEQQFSKRGALSVTMRSGAIGLRDLFDLVGAQRIVEIESRNLLSTNPKSIFYVEYLQLGMICFVRVTAHLSSILFLLQYLAIYSSRWHCLVIWQIFYVSVPVNFFTPQFFWKALIYYSIKADLFVSISWILGSLTLYQSTHQSSVSKLKWQQWNPQLYDSSFQ